MAGGCRPKVRQFISHRKLERHVIFRSLLIPIAAIALPYSPCAYAKDEAPPSQSVTLSPTELFALADRARDAGDFNGAEVAYRALAGNPDIELRTEARFRLGLMLADRLGNPREAAVFFREILDEKPNAARVRFELARMHVMLGNSNAAEREFRAVGATAALPPEVERLVRFYANALSAFKPFGGSIELALAPDTNVNRATRSDTLGTVVGDLTLDEDARARSGVLPGQGRRFGQSAPAGLCRRQLLSCSRISRLCALGSGRTRICLGTGSDHPIARPCLALVRD
jgi:tetratricopeptide (TPR) repeat protein